MSRGCAGPRTGGKFYAQKVKKCIIALVMISHEGVDRREVRDVLRR
jgi:hypothetical protein